MLGFFTSKTFRVWLVVLNVVPTMKSVDALSKRREKKNPYNNDKLIFVKIRDILNKKITLPRILNTMNSRVFFRETIAYDENPKGDDDSYEQTIIPAWGSNNQSRRLVLIPSTSYSKEALDLSKLPNSLQGKKKLYFVLRKDHLNPDTMIIFFARLKDEKIKYAIIKSENCTRWVSKNDIPFEKMIDFLTIAEENFKCLNYSTYFTTSGPDTCPENPEYTLDLGYAKAFNSTWRTFVCFKYVDSGSFNDFRVLIVNIFSNK